MKLTIAFFLVVLAVVASRPNEQLQVLCGRALAEARIAICFGAQEDTDNNELSSSAQDKIRPWLYSRYTKAQLKRLPGIVDECCLKPCYMSQLLSYC